MIQNGRGEGIHRAQGSYARVVASVEARTALEFRDAAHVNICVENDGAQGVRDDEKCCQKEVTNERKAAAINQQAQKQHHTVTCNAGDDGRTPLLDL